MNKAPLSPETIGLYKKYETSWVAWTSDRSSVLASGSSVVDVMNQLDKKEQKSVIIEYILPISSFYVPACQG